MRRKIVAWLVVLGLLVSTVPLSALASLGIGPSAAQESAPAPQTPGVVARLLAERHKVSQLTLKDKLSLKVPKKPEMFLLPDGPSPAVLIRLPDLADPYQVSVRSYMFKPLGLTLKVLVPTMAILDDRFTLTRTIAEADLYPVRQGWTKGPSYEAIIAINASTPRERFILIYTIGNRLGRDPSTENVRVNPFSEYTPKRTAEGKLELTATKTTR